MRTRERPVLGTVAGATAPSEARTGGDASTPTTGLCSRLIHALLRLVLGMVSIIARQRLRRRRQEPNIVHGDEGATRPDEVFTQVRDSTQVRDYTPAKVDSGAHSEKDSWMSDRASRPT